MQTCGKKRLITQSGQIWTGVLIKSKTLILGELVVKRTKMVVLEYNEKCQQKADVRVCGKAGFCFPRAGWEGQTYPISVPKLKRRAM